MRPVRLLVMWLAASCGGGHSGTNAGADGGAGPDGSATQAPLGCDDQNPCTDDRAEDGACRFDPVEDGRPCDDGDLCTLGDRCQAGQCIPGARSPGPLARIGALDSLAGGAIGAIGDRFLAVTGPSWSTHVQLAARQGASLEVTASWAGTRGAGFAADVLVQRLEGDLVAVVARQDRSVAVFSLSAAGGAAPGSPGSIVKRGDAMLAGQLVSLAGHGKRLWACTRSFPGGNAIELVDLTDPDAPSVSGSLPMPADCGSIDTSDDGTRIYVNTRDGVRFIDASPLDAGGTPTLSEVFAPPAGVSTAAGYLVLREAAAVRVLAERDLSELLSIPAAGALAASLVGDRLLVEGWRNTGSGGMEAFVTLYDALGATPAARLDEVILQRAAFQGDVGSSFRNAVTADGSTVITATGQRMFDLTGGRLDELRVPALTPVNRSWRTAGGVRAVGYASSALIDASDPQHPRFAAGGSFGVPTKLEVALEDGTPWPQVLFGDRSDVPGRAGVGRSWEPDPLPVDRWVLDGDGLPRVTGSLALPNTGEGQLLSAGGRLYRMRFPVSPSFDVTLQGWSISALGRAGELAQPAFELQLSPSPAFPAVPGSRLSAFDVDARGRRAVVVTGTLNAGAGEGAVFWLDLATTPPKILEEVHLDAWPTEVRVSGTRAVISTHLELVWLELGKGLVSRTVPTPEPFIEHLLGFDGRTVYYSVMDFSAGLFVGLGLAAFGDSGPAPSPIPLDDTAETMVEVDGALVVGLPSQLVTVHPQCE